MNREQFDRLYLGKVVHCDTEEKANEFLALADSVGYKWSSGKSLIEEFHSWETYEEKTCYRITKDGMFYAYTSYYIGDGYRIIEYQLQPKFKVGDDDMKYRKKPVVIEAVQFNGRNSADIHEFCGDKVREPVGKDYLEIKTLEGIHIASSGDYIIKGVNGEFYPCKPDIFEKTYEKVE
jgi:hypothetical protein